MRSGPTPRRLPTGLSSALVFGDGGMAATLKLQILKIKVFAALDICGGRKFTLALTPALSPGGW
jgi:hypothetical protein